MSDAEQCRSAYQAMYRAMMEKDIPGLDAVLAEDFVLVHMTGMRQPKGDFLRAVADGTLNYYRCAHDAIDVTLRGDTASLAGRTRVTAAVFGGGRHDWRLKQDLSLARRNGVWQITHSEAGTY